MVHSLVPRAAPQVVRRLAVAERAATFQWVLLSNRSHPRVCQLLLRHCFQRSSRRRWVPAYRIEIASNVASVVSTLIGFRRASVKAGFAVCFDGVVKVRVDARRVLVAGSHCAPSAFPFLASSGPLAFTALAVSRC